jgi:hypothetical protein
MLGGQFRNVFSPMEIAYQAVERIRECNRTKHMHGRVDHGRSRDFYNACLLLFVNGLTYHNGLELGSLLQSQNKLASITIGTIFNHESNQLPSQIEPASITIGTSFNNKSNQLQSQIGTIFNRNLNPLSSQAELQGFKLMIAYYNRSKLGSLLQSQIEPNFDHESNQLQSQLEPASITNRTNFHHKSEPSSLTI